MAACLQTGKASSHNDLGAPKACLLRERLKCIADIDIAISEVCCGAVKVIASIEDLTVIKQILTHLERKSEPTESISLPESRAPPHQQ